MTPHRSRLRRPLAIATAAVTATTLLGACSGDAKPPVTGGKTIPDSGVTKKVVTIVAAGDIARTPQDGKATARLISRAKPDAVLPLGDLAYESGSEKDFAENYDPTWGAFKRITRPVPGNHDYRTRHGAPYFDYFRNQIHGQAYYAWTAGRWRMYAVNCEIDCGRDSKQLRWLTRDLAAHRDEPALAYVHEPFFTCSTKHPPYRRLDDIWSALDAANGQIMLSGHNHAYERFARLDESGSPAVDGIRQFVVGSGGAELYPLKTSCPNRQAAYDRSKGVLELKLAADSYSWRFIAVGGRVVDSGSDRVT